MNERVIMVTILPYARVIMPCNVQPYTTNNTRINHPLKTYRYYNWQELPATDLHFRNFVTFCGIYQNY